MIARLVSVVLVAVAAFAGTIAILGMMLGRPDALAFLCLAMACMGLATGISANRRIDRLEQEFPPQL